MTHKTYPELKESRTPWLGKVPTHWRVTPLKYLADFINGDAFNPSSWSDYGTPIIRIQNLNGGEDFNHTEGVVEDRYIVREGDLLFGWSGNRGTSFGPFQWALPGKYALNQHIFRVVPHREDKRFFYWVLKAVTAHVEEQAHGIIGMVHITKGDLGVVRVPIPSMEEQEMIAAFLDRETTKIDGLIAEQYSLIERLKERQTSMISQAVSRGMDPNVPMKESGIDWLGNIPKHWELKRLKGLFRQTKRQNQTGKSVLSVYRDYGVISKDSRDDNNNKTPEDLSLYQLVNINDLVINKMKAWQGSLGISGLAGITSPDYVVFSPLHHEYPGFLHLLLRSERVVSLYRRISNGIRPDQWRLEPDQFLNLYVPLPPLQEQVDICSKVESLVQGYNSLTEEAQRAIELLTEHRSALITAVVTGKLDVREAVKESA